MTPILSSAQIRALDAYTIAHEPIASLDLMERASLAFVHWFEARFPDTARPVAVCCGPGNNGGDGLAVARLLHERAYPVTVYVYRGGSELSPDAAANLQRVHHKRVIPVHEVTSPGQIPSLAPGGLLIDALFGTGLNRPLGEPWVGWVEGLNQLPVTRIAIDLPSGLLADAHTVGPTVCAHHTVSFQLPKLAFFMPENGPAVGEWSVVDIGLSATGLAQQPTPYHFLDRGSVAALRRPRHRFDHKGVFGHALVVAGSYGKIGAAVLCARAVLRAGAGLVTTHLPRRGYEIMQIALPEAMVEVDRHLQVWSECGPLGAYQAVGVGPGLGQDAATAAALSDLLDRWQGPLVVDADGLNLLAQHPGWWSKLPPGSLLTPHPKEFERLFGPSPDEFSRLALLREQAQQLKVFIILKTGHTAIATPSGEVYFNATGNPGMGTAGAGDVLTGILTGLLAQGYPPLEAAQLGVYLHGLAGDLAAAELEQECLLAEDITHFLGKALRAL